MKTLFTFFSISAFSILLPAQEAFQALWQTNTPLTPVLTVSFSSNCTRLASGYNGGAQIKVWESQTGALIRGINSGSTRCLVLDSDGEYVAADAGGGRVRVWRISDGIRVLNGGPDDESLYALNFHPQNTYLAIGRSDGLNVANAPSGPGIIFGEPPGEVLGVCFSPDGLTLASANDTATASLWDVPAGTLTREFIGHSNVVNSVDFSPDGRLLATASRDGTARIWNVTNGVCLKVLEGGGGLGEYEGGSYMGLNGCTAKFSANGQLLYTLESQVFKIWRVADGRHIRTITGSEMLCFDVAKNGHYFAYGTISGTLVVARPPLVLDSITRAGNETVLQWQGGSGLYQLQSNTNLTTNGWQNLGAPTTNTVATNVSSASQFFRVQSLPSP